MAAAHEAAVGAIVEEQQRYAASRDIARIFELLLLHVIVTKPAKLLEALGAEAARLKAAGALETPAVGREKDTEESAKAYLTEHRVHDVFEELFTSVLYAKPADALGFIVDECKRLATITGAAKGAARLYTDEDLRAMHGLYDPSGKGVIGRAQVGSAFRTIGVKATPPVDLADAVDADTFVRVARAAITAEK